MDDQELVELEKNVKELRGAYEKASEEYLALEEKSSRKKDRLAALRRCHAAATEFFNGHERIIPVASRLKVDHDAKWYTDRAETAINLLQVICNHYTTLRACLADFGVTQQSLWPSPTAFANIQRIVVETHPAIAAKWRDEFVRLDLPTHGFDTSESQKPALLGPDLRFFCVGCVLLAVAIGMATWGFSLKDLSRDQRFILHWIFPLASGFSSWSFAGSISAKAKGMQGFAIAATGGFGVWLISNFVLFKD